MGTPIEQARNLGPTVGPELESVGVATLEALRAMGWEEAYERLVERHPHRIHSMCAYALIGAEEGIDIRELSDRQKLRARQVTARLRNLYRGMP